MCLTRCVLLISSPVSCKCKPTSEYFWTSRKSSRSKLCCNQERKLTNRASSCQIFTLSRTNLHSSLQPPTLSMIFWTQARAMWAGLCSSSSRRVMSVMKSLWRESPDSTIGTECPSNHLASIQSIWIESSISWWKILCKFWCKEGKRLYLSRSTLLQKL